MLTSEPRFNQNAVRAAKCVLCGGGLNRPEQTGGELREFCVECIEQEFAEDALELWSWFCGRDSADAVGFI